MNKLHNKSRTDQSKAQTPLPRFVVDLLWTLAFDCGDGYTLKKSRPMPRRERERLRRAVKTLLFTMHYTVAHVGLHVRVLGHCFIASLLHSFDVFWTCSTSYFYTVIIIVDNCTQSTQIGLHNEK